MSLVGRRGWSKQNKTTVDQDNNVWKVLKTKILSLARSISTDISELTEPSYIIKTKSKTIKSSIGPLPFRE